MVFHKSEAIEHHYPKFWEDVQTAANEIKGGYKGKCKGGYKGKNQYKGEYKGKDKGGYKGKDKGGKGKQYHQNQQKPLVASAQANEADQRSKVDQQAGPPYFFRGWGPALQAAAPAAAAAATAAPASADVRIIDAARGDRRGHGSGRPDPGDPSEKSRLARPGTCKQSSKPTERVGRVG